MAFWRQRLRGVVGCDAVRRVRFSRRPTGTPRTPCELESLLMFDRRGGVEVEWGWKIIQGINQGDGNFSLLVSLFFISFINYPDIFSVSNLPRTYSRRK